MTRADYRAMIKATRLRAHALRDLASNPYLQITRSMLAQADIERDADHAWWTLPDGSCDRERVEIERAANRRSRVLELLRSRDGAQLRDSMRMFRGHPIRSAQRLPELTP